MSSEHPSVTHLLVTADDDGFLMPSYVGTKTEDDARRFNYVEDGTTTFNGHPVSWPRLTGHGRYFRDYYRRVGLP